MRQAISGGHELDADGNPAGGRTTGVGIQIDWQDGPLGRGPERKEPNGAFVEGVIAAAIDRLNFYQQGRFRSVYNERALLHLRAALDVLDERTATREAREVEGTHEV